MTNSTYDQTQNVSCSEVEEYMYFNYELVLPFHFCKTIQVCSKWFYTAF